MWEAKKFIGAAHSEIRGRLKRVGAGTYRGWRSQPGKNLTHCRIAVNAGPSRAFQTLGTGLFLLLLPMGVRADDWPQWRGPNRDGVSAETGLLESFPEAEKLLQE